MTIYGICKSCHNHLHIHSKVDSRTALSSEIGTQSKINCKRCGVTSTFNINDLKAKFSKKISHAIIVSILIAIIITILMYSITLNMWFTLLTFGIYTIPALLYISYIRKKHITVHYFNQSKI